MGMLLAFAPFIVFVIVERILGIPIGLASGAAVSAALIIRDRLKGDRQLKILEIGTFILFAVLTVYALTKDGTPWSIAEVRLRVDGGLLIIVLVSLLVRHPFTLQYARESVPEERWNDPVFIKTNVVITAAWAAAFAVMVIADLMLIYMPDLPHTIAIVVTIVALFLAMKFTERYPASLRAKTHG